MSAESYRYFEEKVGFSFCYWDKKTDARLGFKTCTVLS